MEDARGHYLNAKEASAQAVRERAEGFTLPPDGGFAARRALKMESIALAEYVWTLRIFSNLVMDRKIPEEAFGPPESPAHISNTG